MLMKIILKSKIYLFYSIEIVQWFFMINMFRIKIMLGYNFIIQNNNFLIVICNINY